MKKATLILILVLIGFYAFMFFFASGKEYKAEKAFYGAGKILNKIKLNPEATPPAMFESVESRLENIVKRYPDTGIAKRAYVILAEVYITDKKYDRALSILDTFKAKYEKEPALLARAHFLKGVAYEKQGKWDRALEEFYILKTEYVNTTFGLQIPLYVANHYAKEGKAVQAEEEYNSAAAFYTKLEKENAGSLLGYASSSFLIQTYMELGKYEEAGRVVEETIANYPGATVLMQQLPYVEIIFVNTLKNTQKAISIYESVLKKANDANLKNALEAKIKALKSKK